MTQEKRNRIVAAVTVNAVLLLVILMSVLIYQLTTIVALANRKKDIQNQIQEYERQIEDSEDKLDEYRTEEWLKNKAYEYGFIFPGED